MGNDQIRKEDRKTEIEIFPSVKTEKKNVSSDIINNYQKASIPATCISTTFHFI